MMAIINQILNENSSIVSRNRVHIHPTGVKFHKCVFINKSIAEPINNAHESQTKMVSSEPVPKAPPTYIVACLNATKISIETNADGY